MSPTATASGGSTGTDTDPRIAERRRQVEGERRRRLRRRAVVLGVVASVVGVIWLAVHSPLLDTEVVLPVGASNPDRAEAVVQASGVRPGDPLVFVDTAEVARRVASLPWVDTVAVERSWPAGAVEVAVTERAPAAAVPVADGRWVLVDRSGRAIAEGPDAAGVPVLGGVSVGSVGEALGALDRVLVDVAAALTPGLASRVGEVRPGPGGEAELRLADGGVVVLGQPGDLSAAEVAEKLRTVRTVLATVDLNCVERLDVRVSDTAVLTRNPSCA